MTVEIENDRIIPSRPELAAQKRHRPAGHARPVGRRGHGRHVGHALPMDRPHDDPGRTGTGGAAGRVGHPGQDESYFRFIVEGTGGAAVTLRYKAEKARDIETTVTLEEAAPPAPAAPAATPNG